MKLYYSPGACSLSPHVALREAGLPFELVRVDFMRNRSTSDGGDYWKVNPLGYVPALALDNGELLTEGAIIAQYIADLAPEKKLAPPLGTFERVRLNELLHFIATELHKGVSPLYNKAASDELKESIKDRVATRYARLARQVEGKQYLFGDQYTIADGYALYTLRAWRALGGKDLGPTLGAYLARLHERPSVKAAIEAEGLKA